ncbi:DUF443 family protein [Virgibacillus sp. FSP13]
MKITSPANITWLKENKNGPKAEIYKVTDFFDDLKGTAKVGKCQMNCKVQGASKNLRYRVLTINEETYILDLWGSFWKIIFPFFFWMLPNRVYRVDDPNIVEKLQTSEVNQTATGHNSILGAGIGLSLTTLLKPLSDYLAISGNPFVNTVILLIIVIFVFALGMSINNRFKKKLHNIVSLEELSTKKLWIRPKSIKHFFKVVVIYLFFLVLTLVFFYLSIADPDIITLIFTMIALIFLLITSAGPVTMGTTTVKFRGSKKAAI